MFQTIKFLPDCLPRSWKLDPKFGIQPISLFLGQGTNAVEVAVGKTSSFSFNNSQLLEIWNVRKGGRAAPLLLVVLNSDKALIVGASGKSPPIYRDLDVGQVERLCREVLGYPDRHSAISFLSQALPTLETALPGLTNEGLLALHELENGVPKRSDWSVARQKSQFVINKKGNEMLNALGYKVERLDNLTSLLRSGDKRVSLAVMLQDSETAEAGTERFNSLSPISYALNKADDENLDWVILVQGNRIRLYSTSVNSGVGQRGRTETYFECQPALLSNEHLGYLWLIFSAEALIPKGSLYNILEESYRFSGNLAERLRERIYNEVIPVLVKGIVATRGIDRENPQDIRFTYEMGLTVLFRLLFIAYAEDQDLLPYRSNDSYRIRSLKKKAQELSKFVATDVEIAPGNSHWEETLALWHSVANGNLEWGVPAYNGGLFSSDPEISKIGAGLANISLPNECFEAVLRQLIVIETPEGVPGPVDFRSLGVREFGTIYEGLLESELAVANSNLEIKEQKKKGKKEFVYVPAGVGVIPDVKEGEVYLHNFSGARKSTGSFYTKTFAVEYLLEVSLEPALTDHFTRLDKMDDHDASEAFFEFRVADIAMGSGHFLISAIDRIEKRMAGYLANRQLPGVKRELENLRSSAMNELLVGEGGISPIEDSQLLRRLIARRCIYGVDLNGLAVQLARLAVWIHTFVPGLPLSFLDHNLVQGNALVGVGTLEEIREKFESVSSDFPLFFTVDAKSLLGKAEEPLRRLANINDTSLKEIFIAKKLVNDARESLRDTEALCDLISVQEITESQEVKGFKFENWNELSDNAFNSKPAQIAKKELASFSPLHLPVAFPEVFLGSRSGFDTIVGNPPWKEETIEEDAFWSRYYPGIESLPKGKKDIEIKRLREERPDLVHQYEDELFQSLQMRKLLASRAYPGMGTGDPDLYKAFCWRFWNLTTKEGGRIGVVLPRSALSAQGSEKFRFEVFKNSEEIEITNLLNNQNWVFPEVHPQYTICLLSIKLGIPKQNSIKLRGPFAKITQFIHGIKKIPEAFKYDEILDWNESASLPLLPNEESIGVFTQLRKSPRLDLKGEVNWRVRPDRELDATNDKHLFDLNSEDCPLGYWPVYKGESFNIWEPDTGIYYGWAEPEVIWKRLQNKRIRGKNSPRSCHSEFPHDYISNLDTLPCFRPRIAFRNITNRTNQRTVITCLIPSNIFITNHAPYFLWPKGDEKDQAFLLGILSSIPLDWYARRFVEVNLNFYIINPFPIPRPTRQDILWQRVVALAGRLASPDKRFSNWAKAVGVDFGILAEDEKENMIFELDAVSALLCGLNESQLVHIFETFHVGWDYQDRLKGVLIHFNQWKSRMR